MVSMEFFHWFFHWFLIVLQFCRKPAMPYAALEDGRHGRCRSGRGTTQHNATRVERSQPTMRCAVFLSLWSLCFLYLSFFISFRAFAVCCCDSFCYLRNSLVGASHQQIMHKSMQIEFFSTSLCEILRDADASDESWFALPWGRHCSPCLGLKTSEGRSIQGQICRVFIWSMIV